MPSRKQRKRREKHHRHEYELILVDEAGEERPIDPAELRAERKTSSPAKGKSAGAKASAAKGSSRGKAIREVKPPSWSRVWKRAAFFSVFMFLILSFVGGKHRTLTDTLVPTVLYTVLFVPFLYLLDRVQYNQYRKRIGEPPVTRGGGGRRAASTAPEEVERKGPAASLRRALRR